MAGGGSSVGALVAWGYGQQGEASACIGRQQDAAGAAGSEALARKNNGRARVEVWPAKGSASKRVWSTGASKAAGEAGKDALATAAKEGLRRLLRQWRPQAAVPIDGKSDGGLRGGVDGRGMGQRCLGLAPTREENKVVKERRKKYSLQQLRPRGG